MTRAIKMSLPTGARFLRLSPSGLEEASAELCSVLVADVGLFSSLTA
jgi:hypothetical protein